MRIFARLIFTAAVTSLLFAEQAWVRTTVF